MFYLLLFGKLKLSPDQSKLCYACVNSFLKFHLRINSKTFVKIQNQVTCRPVPSGSPINHTKVNRKGSISIIKLSAVNYYNNLSF